MKHINPSAYTINVNGVSIQSSASCKFLGIHLDYRLSGRDHIRYLSNRCSKLLNVLTISRTLIWIPAHSGILGNETADHLAKRAITYGHTLRNELPYLDLHTIPRTELISESSNHLKSHGRHKGIKYFSRFEELNLKPWFQDIQLSRENITTCCRIKSNHYALNHSLHRCNLVADPSCLCGFSIQDAEHIFWDCPILINQRTTLLARLSKLKKKPPYSVLDLLKKPSSGIVYSLHVFLKSSNLFDGRLEMTTCGYYGPIKPIEEEEERAVKEWKQWRKTWQDYCSKTKAKSSKIKKYAQQTGGGPSLKTSEQLTPIEEQVLETLDITAINGHDTIAETATSEGEQKSQSDVKMMSKYGQILVCQNDIKLYKILMFS
ncbi:hypothetical protein RF55_9154 [Lasius niger]|uniref:Uncharacterized protein n=1 Tax=Lasius niger TaxID=67767 RepID=A0A0J7KL66_LASNI|nr:hypothetical protein RF55_9154 [Lasius niger]